MREGSFYREDPFPEPSRRITPKDSLHASFFEPQVDTWNEAKIRSKVPANILVFRPPIPVSGLMEIGEA